VVERIVSELRFTLLSELRFTCSAREHQDRGKGLLFDGKPAYSSGGSVGGDTPSVAAGRTALLRRITSGRGVPNLGPVIR